MNMLANELDEFVTCGVCTSEFDDDVRKPKFLQCAHTVCLSCLKKTCQDGTIICPFCCKTTMQDDANNLPNNVYILHMLRFQRDQNLNLNPSTPVAPLMEPCWCLTCGTLRKLTCTTPEHSTVNLTPASLKNIEALLSLKEDLRTTKLEASKSLVLAIKKRMKFKKYLNLLIEAFTATIEEIVDLQDENNCVMSQTKKELNGICQATASPYLSENFILSNLSSLLDNFNPKDMPTMDALKFKLNDSFEKFEEKFYETVTTASYHDLRKKLRFQISLFDRKDRPIPSACPVFSLDKSSLSDDPIHQDLNLLSCLIFSLLRRQKIPLQDTASSVPDPVASVAQDPLPTLSSEDDDKIQEKVPSVLESNDLTGPTSLCSPEISLPFINPPANNKFIRDQSIFILRMWNSGILKGAIYIRPEPTFHPEFTQSLGEFCFHFPKIFFASAMKAVPEALTLFPMIHPMFQPFLPSMILNFSRQVSRCTINGVDDVGVNKFTVSACRNRIMGWNFVFPLKNNVFSVQHPTLIPLVAELFGRIIHRQMPESMIELSRSQAIDYTLTLESR